MAEHNPEQSQRRRHFHRGRRGPDRRGLDRRVPQPQEQAPGRDQVDVEQIMRDIRARIAQRSGIDLSPQQIQDLAARRLEAILDPRSIKPALLDELRKGAATPPAPPTFSEGADLSYTFEDGTLYESHRGVLRLIRRILSPILKLFFNPNPLTRALNIQTRINAEATKGDAERDRRQAEWNALHYEILQRLVTEVSRVTVELQSQTMRIESLAAKVEFNERRVRGLEGTMHQPARGSARSVEVAAPAPVAPPPPMTDVQPAAAGGGGETQPGEGTRRRRRRRRGRRGSGATTDTTAAAAATGAMAAAGAPETPVDTDAGDEPDADEAEDAGGDEEMNAADVVSATVPPAVGAPSATSQPWQEISPPPVSDAPAEERAPAEQRSFEPAHPEVPAFEARGPEPAPTEPPAPEPTAPEPPASQPFTPHPPSDPPVSE